MCGIVGILSYGHLGAPIEAETLCAMRDSMRHRGPDDAGLFLSPNGTLGLAHRRLSILDLSALGHQPMSTPDGRYTIVFNGEIYNFRELRAELEPRGHRFRSQSDTEVLLTLYAEDGPKMLHRLRGMFALAIWDARERRLWLARDRIGIKPLYYTCQGGRFLFASEIKAILAFPGIPRAVHLPGLYHYLSFLTTPAPLTLFEGIRKLRAGHALTVEADGTVTEEEWWDVFDGATPAGMDEREIAPRLLGLLRESIRYRMVSDVPFGVFLSGGIDSSTNVALMAELMDRPVQTFSIGFKDEERYNEFGYARRVAKRFATDHHEVQIGVDDLIGFLPSLIHHQDEPIADPVCVPVYFVAKLAKDHGVTVCQVGEGSDELFCGYPMWRWFLRVHAWNRAFACLPGAVRRLAPPLARLTGRAGCGYPYECLRRSAAGESLFWGGAEAFFEPEKRRLLSPWVRTQVGDLSSHEIIAAHRRRFEERSPVQDPLTWMGYLDLRLRLPELLLMRVDKMTMATAVEARVPFLDHEFVRFAMSIPQAVKTQGGELKRLLKAAVRGVIPDEIIERPKQGFGVPVAEWFLRELGPVARTALQDFVREQPYFAPGHVEQLLASGNGTLSWFLLNFVLWHRHWIEDRPVQEVIGAAGGGR